MTVSLTTEEEHLISEAAERLRLQFDGQLNAETVDRLVSDSVKTLTDRATSATWIPLLAEHVARDRLRALVRLETDVTDLNPSVLFLCTHNAGRSQMAAGWMRHLAGDQVAVFAGGSEPAGEVNKVAVEAMAEKGIDIGREIPQPWTDEIVRAADVVVSMGCSDVCPVYPGKRYVDWDLDDPSGQPIEIVRRIRDELEARVQGLLVELVPGWP
jgi:arsenate reductase (thioredoxin)